jgi:hypothetical protein
MTDEIEPNELVVPTITRDAKRLARMRWRLFLWRLWKETAVLRDAEVWKGAAMFTLSGIGIMVLSVLWFLAATAWGQP